jgi:hypothetical protein
MNVGGGGGGGGGVMQKNTQEQKNKMNNMMMYLPPSQNHRQQQQQQQQPMLQNPNQNHHHQQQQQPSILQNPNQNQQPPPQQQQQQQEQQQAKGITSSPSCSLNRYQYTQPSNHPNVRVDGSSLQSTSPANMPLLSSAPLLTSPDRISSRNAYSKTGGGGGGGVHGGRGGVYGSGDGGGVYGGDNSGSSGVYGDGGMGVFPDSGIESNNSPEAYSFMNSPNLFYSSLSTSSYPHHVGISSHGSGLSTPQNTFYVMNNQDGNANSNNVGNERYENHNPENMNGFD